MKKMKLNNSFNNPFQTDKITTPQEEFNLTSIKKRLKPINLSFSPEKQIIRITKDPDETEFPFTMKIKEKNTVESKSFEIKEIIEYYEGKNDSSDISFSWILKNNNLLLLSKSLVFSNLEKINSFKRDYNCEFKLIKLITDTGSHKENCVKIPKSLKVLRYQDILPYNFNNVPIMNQLTEDDYFENFIGGSYINGPMPEDKNAFIVTQGPLNTAITKFWKLIEDKEINLIIMLCQLEEDSRKKCDKYWPNKQESLILEDFEINLISEEFILQGSLLLREIKLINLKTKKERTLSHFQILTWPDHQQPDKNNDFKMIEIVINYIEESRNKSPNSPVLVHCSAGLGRSGTLIAISNNISCLKKLRKVNKQFDSQITPPMFSVFNVVRKLREQRYGMITTEAQYRYIYQFCIEWIKNKFKI